MIVEFFGVSGVGKSHLKNDLLDLLNRDGQVRFIEDKEFVKGFKSRKVFSNLFCWAFIPFCYRLIFFILKYRKSFFYPGCSFRNRVLKLAKPEIVLFLIRRDCKKNNRYDTVIFREGLLHLLRQLPSDLLQFLDDMRKMHKVEQEKFVFCDGSLDEILSRRKLRDGWLNKLSSEEFLLVTRNVDKQRQLQLSLAELIFELNGFELIQVWRIGSDFNDPSFSEFAEFLCK